MALQRTRDGFAVAAVKPKGVDRPWSPAVEGGADAVVTRDDDLLSLSSHGTVRILKPADFLDELRRRQ